MINKRIIFIGLSLVLLFSLVLAACAKPSSTTPPTTSPSTTTTSPPSASPLDKIIEGAKKEGKVNFLCTSGVTGEEVRQGIKDKFGVDLEVSVLPTRQTQGVANVITETQGGMAPSFDVMHVSMPVFIGTAKPGGIVADIDWQSLMTDEMIPEMYIPEPGDFMATWTYINTTAYNSKFVSESDLPKSLREFTDPKLKGKFGWVRYAAHNAEITRFLGMSDEEGIQYVSDIVGNGALLGTHQELQDRIILGEVLYILMDSRLYNVIRRDDPESPLRWFNTQDYVQVNEHTDMVVKDAPNINAATLLVLFYCTPEGIALTEKYGHHRADKPGTTEYEMVQAAEKAGTPVIYPSRDKEYLEYLMSQEYKDYEEKIGVALKGG